MSEGASAKYKDVSVGTASLNSIVLAKTTICVQFILFPVNWAEDCCKVFELARCERKIWRRRL